jgi:hypothetical protein
MACDSVELPGIWDWQFVSHFLLLCFLDCSSFFLRLEVVFFLLQFISCLGFVSRGTRGGTPWAWAAAPAAAAVAMRGRPLVAAASGSGRPGSR